MAKQKFIVGDKVKVVKPDSYNKGWKESVGIITNTYRGHNGINYLVLFSDNNEDYFKAGELEIFSKYNPDTNSYEKFASTEEAKSIITDDQLNRMYVELNELTKRLEKLYKFLKSDAFSHLDADTKFELNTQYDAMIIYQRVLNKRYTRLIKEVGHKNVLYMD